MVVVDEDVVVVVVEVVVVVVVSIVRVLVSELLLKFEFMLQVIFHHQVPNPMFDAFKAERVLFKTLKLELTRVRFKNKLQLYVPLLPATE